MVLYNIYNNTLVCPHTKNIIQFIYLVLFWVCAWFLFYIISIIIEVLKLKWVEQKKQEEIVILMIFFVIMVETLLLLSTKIS